jgi:hypothetical protein
MHARICPSLVSAGTTGARMPGFRPNHTGPLKNLLTPSHGLYTLILLDSTKKY